MKLTSRLTLILAILISAVCLFQFGKRSSSFHGDALGYYSYLPSAFIYHNFKHIDSIPDNRGVDSWVISNIKKFTLYGPKTEKGYHINQYTYGVALMELPFFALAHFYEFVTGKPMSGYSDNYNLALKLCSLFYAITGLFLTWLILKRFVSTQAATIVVSLLLIASNIFWFAVFQAGMAHLIIFMLYALVICSTLRLYDNPRWCYFVFIGIAGGLIVVMRPTDMILMLFPVLYKVYSKETLLQKVAFIRTHYLKLLLFLFCAFIPVFPQLLFWKTYTGHWIYDNYTGQAFTWSFQNFPKAVFSSCNGWLFYSKIMFLSLFGILLYKKQKDIFLSLVIILPLYMFVIYSWWCWTYINGFGSRPMIHIYALLAIPFGIFIDWVAAQKKIIAVVVILFSTFCVYANIRWSLLQQDGFLITEQNNKAYVNAMLFKMENDYRDMVMNDLGRQPDYASLRSDKILAIQNFNSTGQNRISDPADTTNYYLKVSEGEEFPDAKIYWIYNAADAQPKSWLRLSGRFLARHEWVDTYTAPIMVYQINSRGVWQSLKITNKIGREKEHAIPVHSGVKDTWGEVFFYGQLPAKIQNGDTVSLSVWNGSKEELLIDDLKIESTKESK